MFEEFKEFRCYQAGDINDGIMRAMREFCPIYLMRQDDNPAGFVDSTKLKADYEKLVKLFQCRYVMYKDTKTPFAIESQDLTNFKTLAGIVQNLLSMNAKVKSIDMDNLIIHIDSDWGEGQFIFSDPLELKLGGHFYE